MLEFLTYGLSIIVVHITPSLLQGLTLNQSEGAGGTTVEIRAAVAWGCRSDWQRVIPGEGIEGMAALDFTLDICWFFWADFDRELRISSSMESTSVVSVNGSSLL